MAFFTNLYDFPMGLFIGGPHGRKHPPTSVMIVDSKKPHPPRFSEEQKEVLREWFGNKKTRLGFKVGPKIRYSFFFWKKLAGLDWKNS